ncbi:MULTISPECIES: hypothetical protein [unclassified Pseudodesulfovibrio]|uniref:hypothetical protein n=1 Tax=unclassified Pseudodesulfovibrio TaxID=2661612 RepID=UPI000FEBEA67|nr:MULTISPECIES: hypothetical protein [unclassified Pseudodesulfovibrio]MCJ2164665.1 hypothetical protein [Pseudodesulfovibrio sp. S3-i]RWU04143.1 hypothetical protein DWB63_09050 [Pseudodesulfovibrio sp. S3]
MSWLRRRIQRAKSGKGNWFGDGSDGDIRITSAGAEQSFDGGVTWSTISTWTLVDSVVSIPSEQDGDMVVINAVNLTVDEGYLLTIANRCRGLLIYCTGNATINGTLSMTARGCHANPADATVTSDTPVAPSDGNAVPSEGLIIRRLAAGHTDTHTDATLGYGCGQTVVDSEANQPEVTGNGVVIAIPRVGGTGAEPGGGYGDGVRNIAPSGGTKANAPGGGGSASHMGNSGGTGYAGQASDGTCFSGGPGSGPGHGSITGDDAAPYGGAGGDFSANGLTNYYPGGSGNPGGSGTPNGNNGTGGLLLLISRGGVTGTGSFESEGAAAVAYSAAVGGPSGGGLIGLFHGGAWTFTGDISFAGGVDGYAPLYGTAQRSGFGGDGDCIGPIKIDQ